MSYNKSLLYTSSSAVISCTVSESVANFNTIGLYLNVGYYIEFPSVTNVSNYIIASPGGNWSYHEYNSRLIRLSISANGLNLSLDGYNILGSSYSTPHVWGNSVNNTSNRTKLMQVYGIDRINYTPVIGLGKPGINWTKYNETKLWSGTNTATIQLSESANNFERLKVMTGTNSTAKIYSEVDPPTADGDRLTVMVYSTESTTTYNWGWSSWLWSNNMTILTAEYGKSFRNTNSREADHTETLNNSDTDFNKRPILSIIGINRK